MINAIYGKKIGMTQIFDEEDRIVPVTVIQAEPNTVCQVKTVATDGYEAVQMGFGYIKPRRVNRPMQGHFDKQGAEPKRYLREVRVENAGEYKVGDEQTVAAFADVKKVDVTGTSKGKGFAGVMKRYGFRGGPADASGGAGDEGIFFPAFCVHGVLSPFVRRRQGCLDYYFAHNRRHYVIVAYVERVFHRKKPQITGKG